MGLRFDVVGLVALLATVGCADDGGSANSSGGSGNSGGAHAAGTSGSVTSGGTDAGGSSGAGGGSAGSAGMGAPKACGPEASLNADGMLTAYPDIDVVVTPAADFAITSFNFVVVEDGDERGPLVKFLAELKNVGTGLHCQFLPEVFLDGTELITLVYGPPKHLKIGDTVFTTVDECIGPGESAVLSGVQRGVTEADLSAANVLTIDPGPSNFDTDVYLPAVPPVIEDTEVVASGEGFVLKGTVSYGATIRNQGIRVYPRDARQLLVDEIMAFPGDLGIHAAGSTAPFETEPTPCAFSDQELFQSWIDED
jgi:hypothetical protein